MVVSLIEVKDLSQEFHLTKDLLQSLGVEKGKAVKEDEVIHTVDKMDFRIEKGEALSPAGESGCGKSTIARTIIHLLGPSGDQVLYKDENISHPSPRELPPYRKSIQMIFQDPYASLNPRQRIKNITMEPASFHGVAKDKSDAREQCVNILNRVELRPEQAGRYPRQFSGGQRQRIGIARAPTVKPEFIIVNELVSALDVSIQAQILNLFMDLKDGFHSSCLFIAHDLSVVHHISDRLGIIYLGALVEMRNRQTLFQNPLCSYTKVLFSAILTVGEKSLMEHIGATGKTPSPVNLPRECFFRERCPYATGQCHKEYLELREAEPGYQAACHIP